MCFLHWELGRRVSVWRVSPPPMAHTAHHDIRGRSVPRSWAYIPAVKPYTGGTGARQDLISPFAHAHGVVCVHLSRRATSHPPAYS